MTLSIKIVWERNAATFYNASNGKTVNLNKRTAAMVFASSVLAILFHKPFPDLFIGIVTIQAILIGFSFNTMIAIATNPDWKDTDVDIREDRLLKNRINLLAKEIFDNLAYFNMIAIFSVVSCLIVLLVPARSFNIASLVAAVGGQFCLTKGLVVSGLNLVFVAFTTVVYVLLLDSLFSFARIVRRTNYFFDKMMGR